ncbi:hypothetical protein [Carboxylicivirga taeanensis]|uniref:hypothetical protein n=1 Tax=Carboxylicivirga taeanensis TaxID=1416875 RepID=UPI003F6DD4D0
MISLFNLKRVSPLSIFLFCHLISSLFILFVIFSGIYKLNVSTEFEEYGLGTDYSVLLLLIVALITSAIYFIQHNYASSSSLLWLLISIGFVFLAMDEQFMIHEKMDHFIHHVLQIQETSLSDRIDDVIILLYGVIGLVTLAKFRHQLLNCKPGLLVLILGGALLAASVVLDIVTNDDTLAQLVSTNQDKLHAIHHLGTITEEVCKIFSETCFIAAFLIYLRHYYIIAQPQVSKQQSPAPQHL